LIRPKVRLADWGAYRRTEGMLQSRGLHSVCFSASCPNIADCWSRGTATIMLLGNVCTRSCGFCAVASGKPGRVDESEPARVADAVREMGLRFAVLTSVARDDLKDGGASIFAASIRAIRERCPGVGVEVLIPDLRGADDALDVVLDARPDVLNHNVETVRRLQKRVRPSARYERSLRVLRRAAERGLVAKSGLMLGLGETLPEVEETMGDLRAAGVSILTIGQYLSPGPAHLPVERHAAPEEFEALSRKAQLLGFAHVESAPLVRSSYHADNIHTVPEQNRTS
jgi:lipoic acid synthetase